MPARLSLLVACVKEYASKGLQLVSRRCKPSETWKSVTSSPERRTACESPASKPFHDQKMTTSQVAGLTSGNQQQQQQNQHPARRMGQQLESEPSLIMIGASVA